ncbi:MAG TPA: hypothetical protein VHR97_13355, partial [Candidatus Baltobacteraceae bacterium]|nr:hypothetical protein [Candidatus Baltobacteraceae bacterium]
MKHFSLVLALAFPMLAGCGGRAPNELPFAGAGPPQAAPLRAGTNVYWSLFYAQPNPQVEIAKAPLKAQSKVTDINGNSKNLLVCANAIRFVGSKLWIMNLSPCHGSGETIVQVYSLPLKTNSAPEKTFILSGPMFADHMTFDASGNLWVPSYGTNAVYEYEGPFTSSGTLSPAITLTHGLRTPQGLGFDSKGNLYVANTGTTNGKNAITVYKAPIANRQPYYLKGVTAPSGLAFDKNGNLFASSNGATGAIAEYASDHLKSGSAPTIVDSTGLAPSPYGADLTFDAAGNLY